MKIFNRIVAIISIFTFTSTQILWADEFQITSQNSYQPVKAINSVQEIDAHSQPVPSEFQTSQDFLLKDLTLTSPDMDSTNSPLLRGQSGENEKDIPVLSHRVSPAEEGETHFSYDYERYEFVDALELLRPEFASAVVLKDFTKQNLQSLTNLSFEVGIIVLKGEIVLFTSGSEDEIGILPAVRHLLEQASFISHTHPAEYSKEGPSGQDINEADGEEYVLTDKSVYAYDETGLVKELSYEKYLLKLLETAGIKSNQVEARSVLNQFIAAQDAYNQASENERETFRRGGTLSFTSGLTTASVSSLAGSPFPYITAGSTVATSLAVSSNQFLLNYNVSTAANMSGITISYDNASTSTVETQSMGANLTFGLKGPNNSVVLEIVDVSGNKDTFTLTNISNSAEKFWRIPADSIANTVDKTRIKQINFIVSQSNTPATVQAGVLNVRVNGLNVNAPAMPVITTTIPVVPDAVNTPTFVLSGTKEANTAILINGVVAVPMNSATTWSATVTFATEGNNTFSVISKNMIGKSSASRTVTIRKDTALPTGSININSGATYATAQTVTLNLSGADVGSGVSKMIFSNDNVSWSAPEAYVTSKSYTLPAGDGSKTVYVRYYDKAGNISTVYSKVIILDTLAPTGTIKVNGGVTAINQTAVTLNLSAADAGAGLDKMSFSTNNSTWSTAEVYAATKAWNFAAGDGNKTVYVRFLDKSGKWSSGIPVTVLLDTVKPATGSININSGALYASSQSVTLNLSAADAASGIDKMSFSTDNVNWTSAESYTTSKSFTLPAGDGNKTVYVKYFDKAGNASAVYSKSIIVDGTLPSGSLNINSGAQYATSTTVNLNLSAADSGSGIDKMSFSTDNVNWTSAEAFTVTKNFTLPAGDGNKTVWVKYYDKAGNWTTVLKTIILDTTGPVGTLSINSGAADSNLNLVTLNLSAIDASGVDKMSFSNDNVSWSTPEAYATSKSYTLSAGDGSKTVYVRYYDKLGNLSPVYSKTIFLDTLAPNASLIINKEAAFTSQKQVTIDLSAYDAGSGLGKMRFTTDTVNWIWSEWEDYKTSKVLTLPDGDGLKSVFMQIYDKAWNLTSVHDEIILDTQAPAAAILINDGAAYTNQNQVAININAADSGAGLGIMRFTTDTVNWIWSEWEDYQPAKALTLPSGDGTKQIFMQIYDKAWNLTSASSTIIADRTAPAGSILINNAALKTTSREVTLAITANDSSGIDQMRFSLDAGQTWTPWETFQLQKGLTLNGGYGDKNIYCEVRDKAGNIAHFTDAVEYVQNWQENLEDGTRLFYEGGLLVKEITPIGNQVFYQNDKTVSFKYADGREIRYEDGIQIISAQGNVVETIVKPSEPIVDFSNALKQTYANGLEAYYVNGNLGEFRTSSGVRVTQFKLSSAGDVSDALLIYPDKTMEIIRSGILLRRINAHGTIQDFTPAGFTVREILSSGAIQYYFYDKLGQAKISGMHIVSDSGSYSVYDELGILRETGDAAGKHYVYTRSQIGEQEVTHLEAGISSAAEDKTLIKAFYSAKGELQKMILKNGDQIEIADGLMKQVTDSAGNITQYSYEEISGLAKTLKIMRGTEQLTYDQSGFLKSIQTATGEITRVQTDSNGDGQLTDEDVIRILLETVGGDTLTDFELDSQGKIVNGILQTKAGIKQKIQNGVLTGFETIDGKVYDVQANRAVLKEWRFQDGTRVVYGGGTLSEILFPDGKRLHTIGWTAEKKVESYEEELSDGTKKIFRNGKLAELKTPGGALLFYGSDGMLEKVQLLDAEPQTVTYIRDSEEAIQQIILSTEYFTRVYSADGTLLHLLTEGVGAEIENNQISRLFTPFGEILHPQFSGGAILTGEVLFSDGAKFKIENGNLTQVTLLSGTVICYSEGRIHSIQTPAGLYEVQYLQKEDGSMSAMHLKIDDKDYDLVTYLLEHPDSEVASILLPRPLHDSLADRFKIYSEFETGNSLFFAKLVEDLSGKDGFMFGDDYSPVWENLNINSNSSGFISAGRALQSWVDIPAKTGDFIDINGDGLPDRVFMNSAGDNFWWVQLNTGQGFDPAVKWEGVNPEFHTGALEYYEGRHPHVLGTFIDINGDNLPDRLMQKNDGSKEWWVQINNGQGFDSAQIWTSSAHPLQQWSFQATYATSVWNDPGDKDVQELIADLIDMDGDGLPDRVLRPYVGPFEHWFWQKNLGNGFADAVLWEGVNTAFHSNADIASSLSWYAQVPNSFETPAAAAIKKEMNRLDKAAQDYKKCPSWPVSVGQTCRNNNYSIMFDARKKIKEAVARYGASSYASYLSDPGVDFYSLEDFNRFMSATSYIVNLFQTGYADLSLLIDLNGDELPDRILLKSKAGQSSSGAQEWWWQKNSGSGFETPVLWADNVRLLTNAPTPQAASSIRYVEGWAGPRNMTIDLRDVTGDGLPDRITVDQHDQADALSNSWWVEVNNGSGFESAARWEGIYGETAAQTAITQDLEHYRSTMGAIGPNLQQHTNLADINGDRIPDRIIFKENESKWQVQFGTGSGFLPVQEMKIESLAVATNQISTSRYDYLHVSLKAAAELSETSGAIKVTLGDPSHAGSYQEWFVNGLTSEWKDFYLPLDKIKTNANQVKIEFVPAESGIEIPVYVDNMTFAAMRPPAAKDWLNRMLVEEEILSEIHSERTQTLSQYLGLNRAEDAISFNWDSLLTAETEITFNDEGQAEEFETLYGSVSKIHNGRIIETVMPDGSKIEFDRTAGNQTVVQRTKSDGSYESLNLNYGRVRTLSRPGKSALEYFYEFDAAGKEITVVYDPDTGLTERYSGERLISRTQSNGVLTSFEYDAEGQLAKSVISYKGRIHDVLNYRNGESGNRFVYTEDGIVEEYAPDGRIFSHTTPDGYRYLHTIESAKKIVTEIIRETIALPDGGMFQVDLPIVILQDDPQAEQVHRVALSDYSAASGEKIYYEAGNLKSLTLPDGVRIHFDKSQMVEKTNDEGVQEAQLLLLDAVHIRPDGTITEYKDGKPFSVTSAAGRIISLTSDNGYLVDPNESAQFHFLEAQKLWVNLIVPKWKEFFPPASLPVQVEYSAQGVMLTRQFAEGAIEVYENGKLQSTLGKDGEVLIEYEYDEEGNPTSIYMGGSRRRLDSSIAKLKAEIAIERQRALARVAEREQLLNQTIEGQYVVVRDRLLAIRAQIENERSKIASIQVKGKKAKSAIGGAVSQIQASLDQVNQALETLARNRSDALKQLSSQTRDASIEIERQSQEAYAQIETENQAIRQSILKQEISPIVYHWYRKILGRDPSQQEYQTALSQVSYGTGIFNGESLKIQLLNSQELFDRAAQVQAIKNRVREGLNYFLGLSSAEKIVYAQSLGIFPAELISLSAEEADSMMSWLLSRSLHFGQSAYIALEAMLANAGISFTRVDLASQLILIDILTGVLTPFEQGDLILSVYAMKRVAEHYELNLDAYRMNFETLKAMYAETCPIGTLACSFKVIAHINGNHYIIITKVTDTEIIYSDPGAGPEDAQEQKIVTKEEFLSVWVSSLNLDGKVPFGSTSAVQDGFGYVLSARPPPAVLSADAYVKLPIAEQMKVRGAFFPIIGLIALAIANAVVAAVSATIAAIGAIVSGLVAGIGAFLSGIGSFFSGLFTGNLVAGFQGLFHGILAGIGHIAGGVLNGLTQFVTTFAQTFGALSAPAGTPGAITPLQALSGLGVSGIAGSAAVNNAILATAFGAGIQGIGTFLNVVGITPQISQSVTSGAKIFFGLAMLAGGNPFGLAASLSFAGGGTSEFLSLHTALSPLALNMISVGAGALGAFAGGMIDPELTGMGLLQSSLPYLSMDLASSGMVAFGNSLGLDPRLSGMLAIPVSAGVGGFFESLNYAKQINSSSILAAIKNGFAAGTDSLDKLVSVGMNIGLEKLGVPPILQNFIPGFLDQLTGGASGRLLENIGDFSKGIGQAVVNGAKKIGQAVVSFGQTIANGFGQAVEKISNLIPPQIKEFFIDKGNGDLAAGVNSVTVTNGNITESSFGNYRLTYDNVSNDLTFVNERLTTTVRNVEFGQNGDIFTAGIEIAENFGDGNLVREIYDNNGTLQELRFNDDVEIFLNNNPFSKIEPLNFENAITRLRLDGLDSDGFIEFRNVDGKLVGDLKINLDETTTLQDGIDLINDISAKIDSLQEVIGIPNAFADNITHEGYEPPQGKYAIKIFVDSPGNLGDAGKLVEVLTSDGPARLTGHSFVALSNGHTVDYRGLYPADDVVFDEFYELFTDVKGVVKTTDYIEHVQNNKYDIATVWYELTPEQFHRINQYVHEQHNYNLASHSCTGFVLDIAKIANIDLGYNPLIYPNPQQLANAINEQQKQDE